MSAALKSVSAKIGKPAPALGVFAMLCALGAAPAHAADVIDSSEVVVTAAGYAQEVKDAPASVTVITRQELENKAVNSLSDALRDVEGVSMLGGDTGTISIRGMESDKVLILVDGRRQNTTGTTQKGGINQGMETRWMPPMEAIERIEVIRGPMSTLYGSEAMGGVINVITRKVGDKWTGAFSTSSTIRQGSGGDALAGDISPESWASRSGVTPRPDRKTMFLTAWPGTRS
ncbi:TonB-dependent receptor plug domain-containing protein [uncultured Bilophila sp.]|uniref:TonB-dependent receptor plug domain-containing protein n=1 Tax=uncultured Bilophila sp. TaxID=529385 RepID=UPI00280BF78C|nr:TonB-dependent receptor plug domain-containing protein [uncultured Bilophila sp.]